MRPNAILILSNIVSNINETYKTNIQLIHRDIQDDFTIKVTDQAMMKVIFNTLLSLEGHTLNFYMKESDTFVVF
jgi:hypothetical protein